MNKHETDFGTPGVLFTFIPLQLRFDRDIGVGLLPVRWSIDTGKYHLPVYLALKCLEGWLFAPLKYLANKAFFQPAIIGLTSCNFGRVTPLKVPSGNRLYTQKKGKMIYGQVHLNIIQTTLSTTYIIIKESSPVRFGIFKWGLLKNCLTGGMHLGFA